MPFTPPWKKQWKRILILQVVDYSDENYQKHMDATLDTLKKLEAGHIPMLYVMNKCDKSSSLGRASEGER